MEIKTFLKHVPNFFLQDWKCNETKVAEEYWAKTQVAGQSCCHPSASSVLGFGFQPTHLCVYIYIYIHTHTHTHTYIHSHSGKDATRFGKCLCICYITVYKSGILVRYNSSESSI